MDQKTLSKSNNHDFLINQDFLRKNKELMCTNADKGNISHRKLDEKEFLKGLDFIMNSTKSKFNGKFYKQKFGTQEFNLHMK